MKSDKHSPPGPKANLLTGNARNFFTDRLGTLTRGREEFGDVDAYRIGPMRGVVVSRPGAHRRSTRTQGEVLQEGRHVAHAAPRHR